MRSDYIINKGRQSILGERWNYLCEWKDLCAEQSKNQGENSIRKL